MFCSIKLRQIVTQEVADTLKAYFGEPVGYYLTKTIEQASEILPLPIGILIDYTVELLLLSSIFYLLHIDKKPKTFHWMVSNNITKLYMLRRPLSSYIVHDLFHQNHGNYKVSIIVHPLPPPLALSWPKSPSSIQTASQ